MVSFLPGALIFKALTSAVRDMGILRLFLHHLRSDDRARGFHNQEAMLIGLKF